MRNSSTKWVFPKILDIPADFQTMVGGSPLVAQSLYRRGIQTVELAEGFLDPALYHPASPDQLPGLSIAVDRLIKGIKNRERILVWGDFDVDGQTSTALLVSGLRSLGADVHHYIPNRSRESHGMSVDSLKARISEFQPAILLTCDTGIDASPAADLANSHDIDLIITDHHQIPDQLPNALAIINPNVLSPEHPLHDLPGVGVAYKLIEELYTHYNRDHSIFLDLVALGIVADVAVQRGDNRYLLQQGLPLLREPSRPGLQQLYQLAGIQASVVNEETIGFGIGPRLNALGRLDDANSCVDFFTTTDPGLAASLAQKLESLNLQRQELTERIFQEALNMIKAFPELDQDYPILVLQGSAQWHPGVIGIVASRLVDRYQKPVIMLSQDGPIARGSARSVSGVPISKLIGQSRSLLISHGGHPMAAGLSLPLENISPFRIELKDHFHRSVGPDPEPPAINIDAEIPFQSISPELINDMKRLSPFGAGNPKPLFAARGVTIADSSVIGRKRNHRKLLLEDSSGFRHDVLWWNSADIPLPSSLIDVAFTLDISTFRDKIQSQATLTNFRKNESSPIYLQSKKSGPTLIDHRDSSDPLSTLSKLELGPSSIIWAELNPPPDLAVSNRGKLQKTSTLVIWTSPPSQTALFEAIIKSSPREIVFFALSPPIHTISLFIPKLLGVIKSAADNPDKPYRPDHFAQAIAVTPALIETGLDWIHLHGDYDLSIFRETNTVAKGPGGNLQGFSDIDKKLKYLLKEISSYRAYYQNARLETIL